MPEFNQVQMWQQQSLAMQFARATAPVIDQGSHLMYRAVQQPPAMTGGAFPQLDALMAFAAPMMGGMMGMQNPMMLPQVSRALNPYQAMYSANSSTQMGAASDQQAFWQQGGAMGSWAGNTAVNMGVPGLINKSPEVVRQALSQFGQSESGMLAAELLTNLPAVQAVMGGNPLAMHQANFGARQLFGKPIGAIPQIFDGHTQADIAKQTGRYSDALHKAIYNDGVTPDPSFTRGFGVEQIGQLGIGMASRGMEQMRGQDPSTSVGALKSMTRVMAALGDLTGEGDMDKLMQSLDKISQGQWQNINPERMVSGFRQMGAASRLLDVSSQQMMGLFGGTQQMLQASAGISPEMAALGVTGGDYTGPELASAMSTRILSIAHSQGVQQNGPAVQKIMAQQIGLLHTGLNSSAGRDAMQIEYLAQRGGVDSTAQSQYTAALRSGDTARAKTIADTILADSYGSAAQGRAMMQNPEMRAMIMQGTQGGGANVAEDILTAQRAEFGYRMSDQLRSDMRGTVSNIRNRTGGLASRLRGSGLAEAQMSGMLGYLEGQEGGGDLAIALQSTYDRAIASGDSEEQAARKASRYAGRSTLFEGHKRGMQRASERAVLTAQKGLYASEDVAGFASIADEISEARSSGMLSGDQGRDIRKLQRLAAQATGDERPGAVGALRSAFNAFKGGLSEQERGQLDYATMSGQRGVQRSLSRFDQQESALARMDKIAKMGEGDAALAVFEEEQVYKLLRGFDAGGLSDKEVQASMAKLSTLDPEAQGKIMEAVSAGRDSDAFKNAMKSQTGLNFELQRGGIRTSSAYAIAGYGSALASGQIGEETYDWLTMGAEGKLSKVEQEAYNEMKGVEDNINLYKTPAQRAADAAAGKTTIKEAMGLREGGPGSTGAMHLKQEESMQDSERGARKGREIITLAGTLKLTDGAGNDRGSIDALHATTA